MKRDEFDVLLKMAGLTQKALGRLLGKDASTISRWGAGGRHGLPIPQYAQVCLHALIKLHPETRRALLAKFA